MKVRYPMHIEEELEDINELISLNMDLMSKGEPDDALKYNLNFLQDFKVDLTNELNLSYTHYMLQSFDAKIEAETEGKIPSIKKVTRFLSNLQEILYSLAESALNKVVKGTKISEEVIKGTTLGIQSAQKSSLIIQFKPINSEPSFDPYLKIATDKLNELLECGSDEDLLREQAAKLGSQPIFRYREFLNDILKDNIKVTLFNEIKPEGYEPQVITSRFAENVYSAIIQAEPKEETFPEEIEGELIIINGKKNKITISSIDEQGKDRDILIKYDNERFSSLIGKRFKKKVKVKVESTEKYYELEEETKKEMILVKFL